MCTCAGILVMHVDARFHVIHVSRGCMHVIHVCPCDPCDPCVYSPRAWLSRGTLARASRAQGRAMTSSVAKRQIWCGSIPCAYDQDRGQTFLCPPFPDRCLTFLVNIRLTGFWFVLIYLASSTRKVRHRMVRSMFAHAHHVFESHAHYDRRTCSGSVWPS